MSTVTGGLIYKPGWSNMQHVTTISFLLLAYANYLGHSSEVLQCGSIQVTHSRLRTAAKRQVLLQICHWNPNLITKYCIKHNGSLVIVSTKLILWLAMYAGGLHTRG